MNAGQTSTPQQGAISQGPVAKGPWIDIDLGALCDNYAMLAGAAPGVPLAPAVKCEAYGLGAGPVARTLCNRAGAREFFVVYPEEGAALRAALNDADSVIYCFGGPAEETLPIFDTAKLTPVLNSLDQAALWAARKPGAEAALHLDTGMNRLGAPVSSLADIAAVNGLNITLVMSHLACASEPDHPKNREQRARFMEAAQNFSGARLSLAASGGALMGKEYHFDLIRPGIALYGGSPFAQDDARIKPVAALRAPILQIRHLAPGETVGYDAAFTAERPTRIATVAIGYGDGYPRAGAGRGEAIIHNERARIVGKVSMDFVTLDVTDLKKPAEPGDIAEFFGPSLRLFEAAAAAGRTAYDFLTGLGGRAHRRYL
ncbi:alanine racemase [Hyphococcus luteus]|uniref:Alanine racemase n=1 Tax=Hyphococcus luteus TaxID=2058213 RepID=A0A2S7JZV9_9PROT|nr:alanine racemase [Marinicaulis flavus]PQA85780.1 alanine racemase [Marinicaulis flavus]